ncbi:HD domain-containing protein [Rathayibacter rathayi]|uniref:HD domain-containing protein n=1 Tax=Rathayibacter rathayi TaxID=33887 RepID=UPI0015E2DB47|nr:HD domain-containing protein [Rathayibacter rathayi]
MLSITELTDRLGHGMVRPARALACYLHRNDTRMQRANLPRTPYIEHPLRNTLRLLRWSVTDEVTLTAALLHDTVEDEAFELASTFANDPTDDEEQARVIAFAYLAGAFSPEVATAVRHMSNPITPAGLPRSRRVDQYIEHVRQELTDPRFVLLKATDLVDNAAGLRHNVDWADPTTIGNDKARNLAAKYEQPVAIITGRLRDVDEKLHALLPDEGRERAITQLLTATKYLDGIRIFLS